MQFHIFADDAETTKRSDAALYYVRMSAFMIALEILSWYNVELENLLREGWGVNLSLHSVILMQHVL